MQRSQYGFTLIEIVVVLVLMSIISAYVIGRSAGTEQVDLVGQTDKIRNQIRFAQSFAMKRSDAIWGIKCQSNQYWMFKDTTATQEIIPGERLTPINLAAISISMDDFELYFDRMGKPYTAYTDESTNTPVGPADLVINLSGGGQSRTITVIPETGMVQ